MTSPNHRERRVPNALAWDFATSPRVLALITVGLVVAASLDSLAPDTIPSPLVRFLAVVDVSVSLLVAARIALGPVDWSRAFRRDLSSVGWLHELPVPFFEVELDDTRRGSFDQARGRSIRQVHLALSALVFTLITLPAAAVAARYLGVPLHGESSLRLGSATEEMTVDQSALDVAKRLNIQLSLRDVTESEDGARATLFVRNPRNDESAEIEVSPVRRTLAGGYYLTLASLSRAPSAGGAVIRLSLDEEVIELALENGASVRLDHGIEVTLRETSVSYLDVLGPAAWVTVTDESGALIRNSWVFVERPELEAHHRQSDPIEIVALIPDYTATIAVSEQGRYGVSASWVFGAWLLVALLLAGVVASMTPRVRGRDGDWWLVVLGPMPRAWGEHRGAAWIAEHFGAQAAREWQELLARVRGASS